MINSTERVGSTGENPQASVEKHPLKDVLPFDLEAATRRIEEAKDSLLNKTEENNKNIDDVWEVQAMNMTNMANQTPRVV